VNIPHIFEREKERERERERYLWDLLKDIKYLREVKKEFVAVS